MSDLDCGCCLLCSTCLSGCVCLGSCMTFAFGCPTKVNLDKEKPARVCPQCDDVAVFPAESHHQLRCFFLPVASFSSKQIWVCDTCDWQGVTKKTDASPESPDAAVKYPETAGRPSTTAHQPSRSREMNIPPNGTGPAHQPTRSREMNVPPSHGGAGRPPTHQPSRSRDVNAPPNAHPRPSKEPDLPNPYEMTTLPTAGQK
ncbi:uncharacterized protein C8Q71DRAFT_331559 [Rhodofomes roseus]|uniref:Uncharacterized protein n=1 Tax=Rhodofomes roseus TaxID=34475 RepID=A0ABQ8KRQ0_9APHY|nr:uncharacterized protein C8Q71DRAFT_331559 [Rhodofomes roseus]KAH9841480.1 hypothetical protein C8Q71DRAFT_331559 [Rhodofomes roseus]